MDIHSKETRSYNMSKVKSKNTKPEETVGRYLFSQGFRYRKNVRALPGAPDIVLPKYKTAIFVNGCFWHVHENCNTFSWPTTNIEFWKNKLTANQERDNKNIELLKSIGWNVIIVWQCELKTKMREERLHLLENQIKNSANRKTDKEFFLA